MNEKLAKKLEKLLAKAGLDEDKIDEILGEVAEASAEEDVQEDGNPEETLTEKGEVKGDEGETKEEEAVVEELPISQEEVAELPETEEGAVPNNDGSIENALEELAAQENATDVPPTDVPQVSQAPQFDPQLIDKLSTDLDEALKTIEGLTTRIQSLEEALKTAGVITEGATVGDENKPLGESANVDASADAFDDILKQINGK